MLEKATYRQCLLNKGFITEKDPLFRIITKVEDYVNNINEDINKSIEDALINLTITIANIRKLMSSNSLNKTYLDIQDELEEIKLDLIKRLDYYKSIYNKD